MYWGVALFQGLCWVSLLALVGTYTWLSVRQHRVHPGLWLALGIFVMSWLESPYDNVMFAVFHPDFYRLPSWPLINLTQGGLPVIAPTGYIMYFLLPAAIAVPIARWAVRRYGWHEPYALLGVGLVVGLVFDGVIDEVGGAGRVHTVNGGIKVLFAKNPASECSFGTVNGSIETSFRPSLSADVKVKTFNGHAYTDYDVTAMPRNVSAGERRDGKFVYRSDDFNGMRIGNGGPELKYDTLNGSIRIINRGK